MFDSPKELLDQIRLGEDSFLELKEMRLAGDRVIAPSRDSLADELAAFANARGGVCILGVDDRTREVLGIPEEALDRVEAYVREACNDSIKPALQCSIRKMFLPTTRGQDMPVLKIDVPKGLFVHKSPGGYFHRIGSSKREMSPDYLARLFQQRSQAGIIRFDEQAVSQATLENLEEEAWRRFQRGHPAAGDERDFLHKLGLARQDEGGVWRPTVAGILLASKDPRGWLPNAYIQAVSYRGKSPAETVAGEIYQLDASDISGPIHRQAVEACRFVARNMRTQARKQMGRSDIPQYDMTAVFEALVNAVAHRDYAIHGSKIRLRMYADRLEIFSPGALANTMTVDSLPLRQAARNELITSLLSRIPVPDDLPGFETRRSTMMDRRGEGVPVILQRSEELSGRRPAYRLIDGEELLLTIYAAGGEVEEAG